MRQLKITQQITSRTEKSIDSYFQDINRYSMISADEEVELSIRIRKGDDRALERLVLANLRFVVSVAKQYQNQGLSFPDLINEGNVGLVKAAKKFDETRGFKFISYAVWWIRQSIMQAISEQTRIVRLPLNRLSSINKISKAFSFLEQEFEREPSDTEIAEFLDLSKEEVKTANYIKSRQISLDKPFAHHEDQDFSWYDLIQEGNIPSPDNNLIRESVDNNISRVLKKLTSRESEIIIKSFGLFGTPVHSLHDIAVIYDLTSERVRQIRNKALTKLKNLLKNHYMIEQD